MRKRLCTTAIFIVLTITVQAQKMKTKAEKFTKAEKELIQLGTGMMHIIQVTDPKELVVLKTVSTDVRPDEELIKLLSERMLLSMNDPANPGIGIAAPQLGINRNVVWVTRFDKDDEPAELYLNPKITWYSDFLRKGKEGCLSIPDIQDNVLRSYAIKISYMDVSGNEKEEMIEGFTAVVFQHEIDHLNGILFTDRLLEQANLELIPANDEMELFLKKSAKKRR